MNYKEARAKAKEINKGSRSDLHFSNVIYADHLDGTKMELWYADLIEEGEWIMFLTEHHGFFVYHKDDLENYYSVPMKDADKTVRMVEMEMDLDPEVIDGITKLALEEIKNDKRALFNYGIIKALEAIVATDGECLKKKDE